jgi:pyridinium-3,5-bisthiocarboxylic acid mononucleotide nickel chelatase
LDDASPQLLGYALERLLAAGALDVALSPLQMKKDRPGVRLEVMARPADATDLARVIFRETPTLGLRRSEQSRWVLPRRETRVRIPGGSVRVKIARPGPGLRTLTPEYEDARACARRTGRPLAELLETARHKARDHR